MLHCGYVLHCGCILQYDCILRCYVLHHDFLSQNLHLPLQIPLEIKHSPSQVKKIKIEIMLSSKCVGFSFEMTHISYHLCHVNT